MRVAVIGSGVSGIAAAKILKQCGYDVTVYERSQWIGGVWCVGYPDLHLQVEFLFICLSCRPFLQIPYRFLIFVEPCPSIPLQRFRLAF
jgi:cation diffusion facilitator CzcD-associated flavoprotein CzcO